MGLRAWIRQRRDSLKTLETRVSELETAWEEKVVELTRLDQKLAKREERAAARALPPEQPRSGGGEVELPQVARYRALRAWRSAKGM
jgi:hypothetical protein